MLKIIEWVIRSLKRIKENACPQINYYISNVKPMCSCYISKFLKLLLPPQLFLSPCPAGIEAMRGPLFSFQITAGCWGADLSIALGHWLGIRTPFHEAVFALRAINPEHRLIIYIKIPKHLSMSLFTKKTGRNILLQCEPEVLAIISTGPAN